MVRKPIQEMIEELRSWLPNYDHGPDSYPTTLFRILASLPGGEELEDMGYEPMPGIAWHEADQLGRMLMAIQDKRDVEDLVAGLVHDEEEGEGGEVGERGRGRRGRQQPWQPMITYPKSASGQYVLSRDGREVMRGSEDDIWRWLHHNHGYSIDHALRYEGYRIEPVEGAAATQQRHARLRRAGGIEAARASLRRRSR